MILQYIGNNEGWYYFFENKEVYDELAANDTYIKPDPAIQALLSERLRLQPERFEVRQADVNEYFRFRFRYQEEQNPETYLHYRILYYRWDDEGYFYIVHPDVFNEKTLPGTAVSAKRPFEAIPLTREKELFFELDTCPDKFESIKGTANDFFYRKFRIKSM
ncbi:MAG: hypothetical protein EOP54_07520 [Sphingobacteriales bacterium]|nr:MAG: hypothetical protein EOP54_07520 [Sphingobacteriales bacterium]